VPAPLRAVRRAHRQAAQRPRRRGRADVRGAGGWGHRVREASAAKVRRAGAGERVMADVVKQQVAAHWDRRAPNFDEDFGHSIRTPAEQLPFGPARFDLVISRHLLWTLPHPEAAIDEWIRVLRPGGRLVVVDGQFDAGAGAAPPGSARSSAEYAAIGNQLPFLGGRSKEQIEALFTAHGLVHVSGDPLLDLVAAQAQRMIEEGREQRAHRRYVVWGDVAR